MSGLTITEALAEIKTIGKRIQKKQQFISAYLVRQDKIKDPLASEAGGSVGAIEREIQSIFDLSARIIMLRRAIQAENARVVITIGDKALTIAEWLVWRRDVLPAHEAFISSLISGIKQTRAQAATKGIAVVPSGEAKNSDDVIINLDETWLAHQAEELEKIKGELDGQLSLKNATVVITV